VSARGRAAPVWAVILAHNELSYTRECLTSILALDPPADRVLLVDNASTDGTAARVAEEFPDVGVLALPENRYFAGGVNAGLERALQEGAGSVLLLNNDLVLERGALRILVEALEQDPSRGAVGPKLFFYDRPDRIWFAGGVIARGTGLIRHRGVHRKDDGFRDGPRPVEYLSGAAVLLSRYAAPWERPVAWLSYGAWTAVLLARAAATGRLDAAGALVDGFLDFTRILLGGTPPARTPEAFARRTAPD
jgi:GT2 family glycosyltransferase